MKITATLVRHTHPRIFWNNAAMHSGIQGVRLRHAERTLLGWVCHVSFRGTHTVTALDAQMPTLATVCGVARARIQPDTKRADRATIYLDYNAAAPAQPYPCQPHHTGIPVGSALPLGITDDGTPMTLNLTGASILVGGNPGSGKSSAIRVLLAGLAQQRNTIIVGIDPKRVELTPWQSRLSRLVTGTDATGTITLLRALLDEVHNRTETMQANHQVTAQLGPSMPAIYLVIDEWAELSATGTKNERQETTDLLRRFISLGRAVGCSAILATQRPTSDTVDAGTRSLLAHRLALRCGDKWQAESILGQGHAEPATISIDTPGRAYYTNGAITQAVQVYDLNPTRVNEYCNPALNIDWPPRPTLRQTPRNPDGSRIIRIQPSHVLTPHGLHR